MHNYYNIGVFDSGVGGTTVLKEIIDILPCENILYYGDSGNSPYGERTIEEIQQLSRNIVNFFITHSCKAVVIACNTATAAALDVLKKEFPLPIIGVISAGAKTAVHSTKNNSINILSTPFTALSKAYANEIAKISKEVRVYQEGCPQFCPMIEIGWKTFEDRERILKEHMSNLSKSSDTLILGCTHYPIIRKDIEKYFSGTIVDPAKETALELKELLSKYNMLNRSNKKGKLKFFISGDRERFKLIAEQFLQFKIDKLYKVGK